MERHDNPYSLFDRNRFLVRMKHLHPGNSTRKQRENAQYFSYLEVFRRRPNGEPNFAETGIYVTAKCSRGDTPTREQARAVLRMKAQAAAEHKGWQL